MAEELQKQTDERLTYQKQPQEFLQRMSAFLDTIQKVYRVQIAVPELRIWKETLKDYSFQEFEAAMNDLVRHPPRYELEDGSIQVWRGMPKLPDVVNAILDSREKAFKESMRQQQEKETQELAILEKRRAEHPEEFISLKEIKELAEKIWKEKGKSRIAGEMPESEPVSSVLLGLDGGARERELERQKKLLEGEYQ